MTPEQIQEAMNSVQELLRRVEALEQWKEQRTRQQLSNPIDFPSQKLIKQAAL